MNIIAFTIFTAMTIAIIPFTAVIAYMVLINFKYHGEAEVYNLDAFSSIILIGTVYGVYFFLAPNCMKYMPGLLGNLVFLICLSGSAAISVIIIGILTKKDKEKRILADLEYQHSQVMKKIETAEKTIRGFEHGTTSVQHKEMLDSQKAILQHYLEVEKNLAYQISMHKIGVKESDYRRLNMVTSEETLDGILYAKDITGII